MACSSCQKQKRDGAYQELKGLEYPPHGALDIMVYEQGETRRFQPSDWREDRHKLLLFFPETFTPVCQTEMGALNDWIDAFDELGVDVYAATTDPIHAVKEWYDSEESLKGSRYRVLSTYILPARLGIMNGGRSKRASVFIAKDGDTITQEHFLKVGRSLKELHRTYYAFVQDSYCAEGWEDPSQGFLNESNDSKE